MHGDAGALVSIGLLRNVSYADMEACIQRQWTTGRLTAPLTRTTEDHCEFLAAAVHRLCGGLVLCMRIWAREIYPVLVAKGCELRCMLTPCPMEISRGCRKNSWVSACMTCHFSFNATWEL